MADVRGDVSNYRRIVELEGKSPKSMEVDYGVASVLAATQRARPSVGKVEYFEVGAVGQRNQEHFK